MFLLCFQLGNSSCLRVVFSDESSKKDGAKVFSKSAASQAALMS